MCDSTQGGIYHAFKVFIRQPAIGGQVSCKLRAFGQHDAGIAHIELAECARA
jgi:hypothetical protein